MNGTPRKVIDDVFGLTDIELEIVRALCAGRNCSGAGAVVGLSKHTVADYLRIAYKKMGVYQRASMAVKAERAGLLVGVEV